MKNKEQLKQLKELAKEAYNSNNVCEQWKNKIEQVLPELKTGLEVGKWYKWRDDFMFCFNGEFGNGTQYGFDMRGRWKECLGIHEYREYILATKEEVEEALIKEAKKRGFKEGGKVAINKGANKGLVNITGVLRGYRYIEYENSLDSENGEGYYFYKGEWAEIIEPNLKEIEVKEHEEIKPKTIELDGKKYKLIPIE